MDALGQTHRDAQRARLADVPPTEPRVRSNRRPPQHDPARRSTRDTNSPSPASARRAGSPAAAPVNPSTASSTTSPGGRPAGRSSSSHLPGVLKFTVTDSKVPDFGLSNPEPHAHRRVRLRLPRTPVRFLTNAGRCPPSPPPPSRPPPLSQPSASTSLRTASPAPAVEPAGGGCWPAGEDTLLGVAHTFTQHASPDTARGPAGDATNPWRQHARRTSAPFPTSPTSRPGPPSKLSA